MKTRDCWTEQESSRRSNSVQKIQLEPMLMVACFFPPFCNFGTLHARLTVSMDTVFIKQYSDPLRSPKENYIYVCGTFCMQRSG